MASEVTGGHSDGSLEVLRHLKDAEDSGEARIAQAKAQAAREVEEARAHAQRLVQEHRERAQELHRARVSEGLAKARQEAEGFVTAARAEAAKISQLNLLDVEMLFPEILEALFAEFRDSKPLSGVHH